MKGKVCLVIAGLRLFHSPMSSRSCPVCTARRQYGKIAAVLHQATLFILSLSFHFPNSTWANCSQCSFLNVRMLLFPIFRLPLLPQVLAEGQALLPPYTRRSRFLAGPLLLNCYPKPARWQKSPLRTEKMQNKRLPELHKGPAAVPPSNITLSKPNIFTALSIYLTR